MLFHRKTCGNEKYYVLLLPNSKEQIEYETITFDRGNVAITVVTFPYARTGERNLGADRDR